MEYSPKYRINAKIRYNLQEIDQLRNVVHGHFLLPEHEMSIRLRATVDTIHSSTSIEGNPLGLYEVREVISSRKKLTKNEYAEIEVQNYKNVLDYIEKRKKGLLDISLDDVLLMHGIITKMLLDDSRSGHLRKNQIYIENQNRETVYEAAAAKFVESDTRALLDWVNENRAVVPTPILAGILHYQLVTIHPFSDGNGRTARALALLYLAMNNYDCNGSLALDSFYSSDRRTYYDMLQRAHGSDYEKSKNADLTEWLEYFTDGLLVSLHILDAEIRILNLLAPTKNTISREATDVLSYVAEFGSITISEAEAILPELNRRTTQRLLKKLVEKQYLELVGATRDSKYILKITNKN